MLPTLFITGLVFALIGGLLIWGSALVSEITFDYTDCENLTPSSSNGSLSFSDMPSNKYNYRLRDSKNVQINAPRYAFLDNTNNASVTDVSAKKQCVVEFQIPQELKHSVLFYYKLSNFYQNHRRYVKSLSTDQLIGKFVSATDLNNGDCKPLAAINNTAIFPCGLIANSIFNGVYYQLALPSNPYSFSLKDTFSSPVLLDPSNSDVAEKPYEFSSQGIAWPGESKKYTDNPIGPGGYQSLSDIVPPPNWALRYPNGYTDESPPPNLKEDEHFQNWMRTAGLPTFTKLYGRNDNDNMASGTYKVIIGLSKLLDVYQCCIRLTSIILDFPVIPYKGTKSFVISTVSWIGGKNPFLGWAYVAASALFVLLSLLGTARHLIRPRQVFLKLPVRP